MQVNEEKNSFAISVPTAGSVAAKSSSSCDSTSDNYGTEFFKVNLKKFIFWDVKNVVKNLIQFQFSLSTSFLPFIKLPFAVIAVLWRWKPQDCCEACKIGLVIGSTSQQCSTDAFSFGSPWDDIIEDCCSDIRDSDSEGEETSEESEWFSCHDSFL